MKHRHLFLLLAIPLLSTTAFANPCAQALQNSTPITGESGNKIIYGLVNSVSLSQSTLSSLTAAAPASLKEKLASGTIEFFGYKPIKTKTTENGVYCQLYAKQNTLDNFNTSAKVHLGYKYCNNQQGEPEVKAMNLYFSFSNGNLINIPILGEGKTISCSES